MTDDASTRVRLSTYAGLSSRRAILRIELALAALAVAVERRPTDFAEEFLHDLARPQIAEMGLAIRVARECLRHRTSVAVTTAKTRSLGPGNGEAAAWDRRFMRRQRSDDSGLSLWSPIMPTLTTSSWQNPFR